MKTERYKIYKFTMINTILMLRECSFATLVVFDNEMAFLFYLNTLILQDTLKYYESISTTKTKQLYYVYFEKYYF